LVRDRRPFGSLTSPNITPDPDAGIGSWTDDQFYSALHDGITGNERAQMT
jgi:hypothetical protein